MHNLQTRMMDQDINENEVLSDCQSVSATRPSSSASSDMPRVNIRSRRNSFIKHPSSMIDVNDLAILESKQSPVKVLVINGKCSQIFKSALEGCVEDCILEYPEEQTSFYVSKPGQVTQIPIGSHRNSLILSREQTISARQSAKSNNRRRNSLTQHHSQSQMNATRTHVSNNFSLPAVALAATAAVRARQATLPLVEDISEEQISIAQFPRTPLIEPENIQSERPSVLPDQSISPMINRDISSFSSPIVASMKRHVSYSDRYKDYRLSDLVVLGPEHFTHVFNLPRHTSQSRQRNEKLTELDRIKQDLFHHYLWTQKPQVLCRIRPLTTYTRRSTLVL